MNQSIIKKAIETYGFHKQMTKTIEEVSELTKAICKFWLTKTETGATKRIADMQEETADCIIMLEQMKIMVGAEKVDEIIKSKLERLKTRLEEE